MRRGAEVLVVIAILACLSFLLRPALVSREPVHQAQAEWKQQLQAVAAGQSTKIIMPDLQIRPEQLVELKPYAAHLTELNLSGDHLVREIETIAACSELRILHLRTTVGDGAFKELVSLRQLEVLDLPQALGLTDAGLAALADHPRLRLIRLRAPQVTDAGLATFQQLPELRWLHLMEVPVTDAGLFVFQNLPKLESLYLDGDRATDDGLSALVLARPDLHFHRDQLHLSTDPRQGDGHVD